jgi:hypothetical protein
VLREEEVILIIFCMVICAGVLLMIAAMWTRRRMREMTHRERLAMIDRGMIPASGGDPVRLDPVGRSARLDEEERGVRFRTGGVLLIGLGLGLTVLITFTGGGFDIGIGIGGAFTVLGGASLLNYFLISRGQEEPYPRWTSPPRSPEPRTPDSAPSNDAPPNR